MYSSIKDALTLGLVIGFIYGASREPLITFVVAYAVAFIIDLVRE